MFASCPIPTFNSRVFFCWTLHGAMCESLAFNSFAVCSQTPESLYQLFYFVFISSVNLLIVARIKKSIFKIQYSTKPVCWYNKLCKLSDTFSASSFLIATSPPITRAAVPLSSPHPISGIDAFGPPNPPGPPLPPPHDGRYGPRGSGLALQRRVSFLHTRHAAIFVSTFW